MDSTKVTCMHCQREIPNKRGMSRVDSVLLHYIKEHPDKLSGIDQRQLTYQTPQ